MTEKNDIFLDFKKKFVQYSMIHKSMDPNNVYVRFSSTEKCLQSALSLILEIENQKKSSKIEYIDLLSDETIKLVLNTSDNGFIKFNIGSSGEISGEKITKSIFKIKEKEEIKTFLEEINEKTNN